jgi:hypothetical protein
LKKGWKKKGILAIRGDCKFIEKTKNAQALGADLVIIYDPPGENFIVPTTLEKD